MVSALLALLVNFSVLAHGYSSASVHLKAVGTTRGATEAAPQEFYAWLVREGILDGEYVRWVNCEGGPWDKFRTMFQAHLEAGHWNYGEEAAWVTEPEHWKLIKEAERMLEWWRREDFQVSVDNTTLEEAMLLQRRSSTATAMATVTADMVGNIAAQYLYHISEPRGTPMKSFAAKCLSGVLAASCVFARALHALGQSQTVKVEDNEDTSQGDANSSGQSSTLQDGFMLWRLEMGFLIAGFLVGEGLSLMDLTSAPGWPGISTRFLEQLLHRPLKGGDYGLPPGIAEATSVLGAPRRVADPVPKRMPPAERYHSATDPQGVTSWGSRAAWWLKRRAEVVRVALESLPPGQPIPWARIGQPYFGVKAAFDQEPFLPQLGRQVRMMTLITGHGALDLEVPELLLHMFPHWFEARFVQGGPQESVVCKKTEGSRTIDRLCAEGLERKRKRALRRSRRSSARHRRRRRRQRRSWELKFGRTGAPGGKRRKHLFEARDLLHPRDPRVYFYTENGKALKPDLFTTTNPLEAMQIEKRFPKVPIVVFFGPPVMLIVAEDMVNDRQSIVDHYWRSLRGLLVRAAAGRSRVFFAGESLFRCEQFFWQTGVQVPFLRPMSVWVNATYSPSKPAFHGGEVLIHNRGRLKYEMHFIRQIDNMAGPRYPYKIVAQAGRVIPFKEIAGFHAVVIVPWSPELCMLRHLFKMRMPLMVPDLSLLRNLVHIANIRLMPYPYNEPDPGSDRAHVKEVHPFDPFVDTSRSPSDAVGMQARAYWAEYSEYLLLPCLLRFVSVADLLARLNGMDGQKTSQRMRTAYLHDLEEMRSFWEELLPTLF